STLRLDLCRPMAPALPVGERGFRQVPVSWAALKQAAACQWFVSHGAVTKAQGASGVLVTIRARQSLSRTCRLAADENGALAAGLRSPDVRAGPHRGPSPK